MSLSTHVLDTSAGRPAADVPVSCAIRDGATWRLLTERRTDRDGRVGDLIPPGELTVGVHRLTFATSVWAEANGTSTFYPEVVVTFTVAAPDEHHHVPLLLSPYGYSTYRGS
jgi:5-hydroxyisourate hydrolase